MRRDDNGFDAGMITRRRLLELLGYAALGAAARPVFGQIGLGSDSALPVHERRGLGTRLTREYGLRHPIVGAGMGFYAMPELVAAISNAGALGVLGAAPVPPPYLQLLIQQTKALTPHLFGVDLVNTTLFGAGVPATTDQHIDVCIQEGVRVVVFFWETPEPRWVERLHAAGARVWMQVGTVEGAREAVGAGVDLLIAQGSEAGGHNRGAHEQGQFGRPALSRSELIPLVKEVAGPRIVLGAGGIADGRGLAKVLREGAEGAWVGTRFAASLESYAHDEYKRRVVLARSEDTAVTTIFGPEWPGAAAGAIRNRVVGEWAGREHEIPFPPPPPPVIGTTMLAGAPYAMPKFSAALPTRDTVGDFEEMFLAAGSVSTGLVNDIKPAAQIIEEMAGAARRALERGLSDV